MANKISIKINGKEIFSEEGRNVLEVAIENQIDIPFLCFHPDVKTNNHCGLCIVEVKGKDSLQNACELIVEDGMEIITDSAEIFEKRKKRLEEIVEKHLLECDDCVWFQNCKLLDLTKKFEVKPVFKKDERDEVLQVGTIVFDQTKCIGCGNCIETCPTKYLSLNERNKIECSTEENKDCINCGQCILCCSVGAIEGVGEFESLKEIFQDKNKITVVQFAPAIRSSIGEEFNIEYGKDVTVKLISALKKAGFDYVFDTATGADFTTMEESEELIERIIENKNLPAMTSCCPAWVSFIEKNYPEFIPCLCSARSPQAMLGGIVKNYWSGKNKLNREDIFVVSVMPCVAKKHEIKRSEIKIDGDLFPVDMVLTTRELARLLKSLNIDLKNIEDESIDTPFGEPSGAGVIYGSSGGVVESALRTAYFKVNNKELEDNEIKEVRGIAGIKVKEISLNDKKIKICVVNGIDNARKILEEIKVNPRCYDAIEVMACPGGCVGGGGQPMPSNKNIIKKRGEALYLIDLNKKNRRAHENPDVKKVYNNFFQDKKTREDILHTKFSPKNKENIIKLKNSRETL